MTDATKMTEVQFVNYLVLQREVLCQRSKTNAQLAFDLSVFGAQLVALFSLKQIHVRPDASYGRGVFATNDLKAGAIVSMMPVHASADDNVTGVCYRPGFEEMVLSDGHARDLGGGVLLYADPSAMLITGGSALAHMVNDPYADVDRFDDAASMTPNELLRLYFDYRARTHHSSNCTFVHGSHYVYLKTTKPIARGVELTAGYGFSHWCSSLGLEEMDLLLLEGMSGLPPGQQKYWVQSARVWNRAAMHPKEIATSMVCEESGPCQCQCQECCPRY